MIITNYDYSFNFNIFVALLSKTQEPVSSEETHRKPSGEESSSGINKI